MQSREALNAGTSGSPEGAQPPLRYAFPSARGPTSHNRSSALIKDMDALKQRMATAKAGTGEVAAVLSSVTFQPRAAAFTSLIQAASKAKATEKALELFQCMQDIFGIPPNTFSSSALISALAKSGQWELAEFYFHDLVARSSNDPRSRPNTVTFSALLNGAAMCGRGRPDPPQLPWMPLGRGACRLPRQASLPSRGCGWSTCCLLLAGSQLLNRLSITSGGVLLDATAAQSPIPILCSIRERGPVREGAQSLPAAARCQGRPRPHHLWQPGLGLRTRRCSLPAEPGWGWGG